MKFEVLAVASFLRSQPFSDDNFAVAARVPHFCRYLDKNRDILNYDGICPLLIIVAGFWSSAARKARNLGSNYHIRAAQFYEQCLRQLLLRGVNINIHHRHRHLSTVMHWLIAWDRPTAGVKFLDLAAEYQLCFNPEEQDSMGNTPLTLLVARKYLGRTAYQEQADQQLIERLLASGADPYSANKIGETAVDYACNKHDIAAVTAIAAAHPDCYRFIRAKNHLCQSLPLLTYQELTTKIFQVYEAAKIHHIVPVERWQQDGLYFENLLFANCAAS